MFLEVATKDVLDLLPWPGSDYEERLRVFQREFHETMEILLAAIAITEGLVAQVDRMAINPYNLDAKYAQVKMDEVVRLRDEVFLTITRAKVGQACWKEENYWRNQLRDLYWLAGDMALHESFIFN